MANKTIHIIDLVKQWQMMTKDAHVMKALSVMTAEILKKVDNVPTERSDVDPVVLHSFMAMMYLFTLSNKKKSSQSLLAPQKMLN